MIIEFVYGSAAQLQRFLERGFNWSAAPPTSPPPPPTPSFTVRRVFRLPVRTRAVFRG